MSDEEEEYYVDSVLKRKEFERLLEEALASNAKFTPPSIHEGRSKHSKFAYLVHWKGFGVEDRTWEPESNLKNCAELQKFKEIHNMPDGHQKFEKRYGEAVWRNLGLASEKVVGYKYLMTSEEIQERKLKKQQLAKKNELEKEKHKDKPRERMVTPEDPETLLKKKKKKKEKSGENGPNEFRIPKKKVIIESSPEPSPPKETVVTISPETESRNSPSTSKMVTSTSTSRDFVGSNKEFKKTANALPGIKPLNQYTPRIQKKSLEVTQSNSLSPGSTSGTSTIGRLSPAVITEPPKVQSEVSSSSTSTAEPLVKKIKLKKKPDGEYENISALAPVVRYNSDSSTISTYTTSQNSDFCEIVEDNLDKKIQEAEEELEGLDNKLKKYPKKINVERVSRSFAHALNLRKFRRCQSEGGLNEFFNTKADLEIFGKNYESSVRVENGALPPVIRVYTTEPWLGGQMKLTSEQEENIIFDEIVKENLLKMKQVLQGKVRYHKNFKKLMELLVTAYSRDDNIRFKKIFLAGFADETFDSHRYAAIIMIISYCRHRKWNADPRGTQLVESDESNTLGGIREQEHLCSENHRKCTWTRLFLELVPSRLRFLETSGRCFQGVQGDDGPFRDDVYFQCMRVGAECQKRLFFEFDKPIGIQEETEGDYMVDVMHILAVQHGNLQRIPSYMSVGGLDINALATYLPTKQVYRLHDYLKDWIDRNISSNHRYKKYYNDLLEMVRLTSESMERFLKAEVNEILASRMNSRWKIHLDLTYAHTLRVSPINNVQNLGDGTHQVLACLFSPQGVGIRNGLEADSSVPIADLKNLKSSHSKFQKLVAEQQGRLVIALFRVEIEYQANVPDGYALPVFKHVRSDDGIMIEKLTLLRQGEGLSGKVADIGLIEMTPLSSPGCRYYCVQNSKYEKSLVVPGNAHIEIRGEFAEPMTFVTQVYFIKKNF